MAIEISSRSKYYQVVTSPLAIVAMISVLLIAILLSAYLFFVLNISNMKKEIFNKEREVVSLTKSIAEKERIIIPLRDKISNFNDLVANHNTPINALSVLEQNTFPNVWFSQFDFNFPELTLALLAHTDDLATVEQQVAHLRKNPLFESVTLSEVAFAKESGVDFNVQIIFSPVVFSNTL